MQMRPRVKEPAWLFLNVTLFTKTGGCPSGYSLRTPGLNPNTQVLLEISPWTFTSFQTQHALEQIHLIPGSVCLLSERCCCLQTPRTEMRAPAVISHPDSCRSVITSLPFCFLIISLIQSLFSFFATSLRPLRPPPRAPVLLTINPLSHCRQKEGATLPI